MNNTCSDPIDQATACPVSNADSGWDRPIFIVGSPRSGTTLMCNMIDAHPHIFAPYWETGLFIRFEELLTNHLPWVLKEHPASFPLKRKDLIDWIRESVQALFGRFAAVCGKRRWAEKTPGHVFQIKLIHEVFPQAQFIHMIRNGRDVVRSLQNMPWAPRRLRWSIQRWMMSVRAGREQGAQLPPGLYTEVRYEDLVAQPAETLRRVCQFLGEPFSEQMLAFHLPENNSWRYKFEPLKHGPINAYPPSPCLERLLFWYNARGLMRELGYA